ncbi:MAG: hypothetical protein V3U16_09310 [Candidatus Neomarinimicrobiota bacterium]
MKRIFCMLLIVTALLLGQDTTIAAEDTMRWNPVNTPDISLSDTLIISFEDVSGKNSLKLRYAGAAVTLASGVLTWYFHQNAEKAYEDYQKTGDIGAMDQLYSRAERFDKLTGLSYVGIEIGIILFALSFFY